MSKESTLIRNFKAIGGSFSFDPVYNKWIAVIDLPDETRFIHDGTSPERAIRSLYKYAGGLLITLAIQNNKIKEKVGMSKTTKTPKSLSCLLYELEQVKGNLYYSHLEGKWLLTITIEEGECFTKKTYKAPSIIKCLTNAFGSCYTEAEAKDKDCLKDQPNWVC